MTSSAPAATARSSTTMMPPSSSSGTSSTAFATTLPAALSSVSGLAFSAIEVWFSFVFCEVGSAFNRDALAIAIRTHRLGMVAIAIVTGGSSAAG